MKKVLFVSLLVIGMMATTSAQTTISFTDEVGCHVEYDITTLSNIITTGDTLADDNYWGWLLMEYETVFPSKRGSHEPAILVLIPDDPNIMAIFVQANKKDKLLSFRMLTNEGWLEVDRDSLGALASIIY